MQVSEDGMTHTHKCRNGQSSYNFELTPFSNNHLQPVKFSDKKKYIQRIV
jgi:hypothetical protein